MDGAFSAVGVDFRRSDWWFGPSFSAVEGGVVDVVDIFAFGFGLAFWFECLVGVLFLGVRTGRLLLSLELFVLEFADFVWDCV